MTNEVGSKTRTNKIETTAETRTQTGDKTQGLPNITLLQPHHPMPTSPSPWIWTVPALHQEEDVR